MLHNSAADLRFYSKIEAPRFKKDWPGQLVRIFAKEKVYDPTPGSLGRVDDPVIPENAVYSLRSRYNDFGGDKDFKLTCDWHCPCCGKTHERIIKESALEEKKAEFVEDAGAYELGCAIIYLAAPYTHPDAKLRERRWLDVSRAAAWLMLNGLNGLGDRPVVFSPLSMGHPISRMGEKAGLGHDAQTWAKNSQAMLNACTHLVILKLAGWTHSKGLRWEVDMAHERGMGIWGMTDLGGDYDLSPMPKPVFHLEEVSSNE